MQSLDVTVLEYLCNGLQQSKLMWLCTVVRTWGSAPRRIGSLLASCEGQFVGSLSGGCVEDDLIERLQSGEFCASEPHHICYGASKTDLERFNLPCGGTLELLIEPLVATHLKHFQAILAALHARKRITRSCQWPQGHYALGDRAVAGSGVSLKLHDGVPAFFTHRYGPEAHLFVIGCNAVSAHLAQFALAAGYRVTVCDPRPKHYADWAVADVQLLHTAMPDDAILRHANDLDTAIVAVTHDPRMDDMGLMVAFDTSAFYIGAMGSDIASQKRRERLAELGVKASQLERLHAPVGIAIGSKTPAEIAISILAEIIAVRSSMAAA